MQCTPPPEAKGDCSACDAVCRSGSAEAHAAAGAHANPSYAAVAQRLLLAEARAAAAERRAAAVERELEELKLKAAAGPAAALPPAAPPSESAEGGEAALGGGEEAAGDAGEGRKRHHRRRHHRHRHHEHDGEAQGEDGGVVVEKDVVRTITRTVDADPAAAEREAALAKRCEVLELEISELRLRLEDAEATAAEATQKAAALSAVAWGGRGA